MAMMKLEVSNFHVKSTNFHLQYSLYKISSKPSGTVQSQMYSNFYV